MSNEIEVTKEVINMHFRGYDISIPKGTRITHQTACGFDPNYNFISDLSWIKSVNGIKQYGLIHDATYYGINISKNKIEKIKV